MFHNFSKLFHNIPHFIPQKPPDEDFADFMGKTIQKNFDKFMKESDKKIKKIDEDFGKVEIKEMANLVTKSEELDSLVNGMFAVISNLDQAGTEFSEMLTQLDFKIRQDYNAALYKLNTNVNALNVTLKGEVHFVGDVI